MSKRKSLPLILVVESDENDVLTITHALANEEAAFSVVNAKDNLNNVIEQGRPQIIILSLDEIKLTDQSNIIAFAKQCNPNVIVIVTSQSSDPVKIVESVKFGAFDYLTKPLGER